MSSRSIRYRLSESNNIWPGFVDILATLLIVIIFVLMVFTVSQIYLSDAISGRDKALENLRNQINELSKILVIETREKEKIISQLQDTEESLSQKRSDLLKQEEYSKTLQTDIAKKDSEIFIQDQNLIALSDQIKKLLNELRVVAKALETYEGAEITLLETDGLGERINKALASRIDQLNQLNISLDKANNELSVNKAELESKLVELDQANNELSVNKAELESKLVELDQANNELSVNKAELEIKIQELNKSNSDLMAINESLGLDDADLIQQLAAIEKKNELLELSQKETQQTLKLLEKVNADLVLKDEALQDQISQYQEITKDLLAINDSLGLKDASLIEQLEVIRSKNQKLAELNNNLIEKDNTIFNLRGKILELNNILSISEEKQLVQQEQIEGLTQNLNILESQKKKIEQESADSISEMQLRSSETMKQVTFLTNEIETLKEEISILNDALESNEQTILSKELKIEVLGERLNKALTSKVFELQKYRSEFFGKLKSLLGERDDIKIVGDRFIFESELLFDSASADLQLQGMDKLKQIGLTLKETTNEIPSDIDWIIQVEGHTDKRPINTPKYPSNWELSTARANSVLKLLLELGFPPNRLSAAGYGEFYPISDGETKESLQQNRRIELKLTSR
ncbi:OmpA family protein [Alphaproteobacteria bacterium]|nr:OmpA family protein [Alphaproteobacteria bacterium]